MGLLRVVRNAILTSYRKRHCARQAKKLLQAIRIKSLTEVQQILEGEPNAQQILNTRPKKAGPRYDVGKYDVEWNPLCLAVELGYFEIVRTLLERGADPNLESTDREAPLHWALLQNRKIGITELLIEAGADVNKIDSDGETPLHWAVVNASEGEALPHWGVVNNSLDIIERLLARGADVNQRNARGETPLALAARYGCQKAVELMKAVNALAGAPDTIVQKNRPRLQEAGISASGSAPRLRP